jgi:hypothetical protein
VRLITWNVNRRVERLAAQAGALAAREPDVVALQEITARSWPLWRAALETIGHAWRDGGLSDHSALEVDLRTAAVVGEAGSVGDGEGRPPDPPPSLPQLTFAYAAAASSATRSRASSRVIDRLPQRTTSA